MTRKHFNAIAATMLRARPIEPEYDETLNDYLFSRRQWEQDCRMLGHTLGNFNNAFDHNRFLEACGYNSK